MTSCNHKSKLREFILVTNGVSYSVNTTLTCVDAKFIVGVAVHYFLSLILPLYMSGEDLIWEAAMMIF